jgi:fibronectin type 3 domain-containing protein
VAPSVPIAGYRAYHGTSSGKYMQAMGSGTYSTQPTYTFTGLPAGHTYYFAVTSIDPAGNESAFSSEVSKAIP